MIYLMNIKIQKIFLKYGKLSEKVQKTKTFFIRLYLNYK